MPRAICSALSRLQHQHQGRHLRRPARSASAAWCAASITLYTPNTVVILDDLRYANDPAAGVCIDILGTISGANTIVADNGLNTPIRHPARARNGSSKHRRHAGPVSARRHHGARNVVPGRELQRRVRANALDVRDIDDGRGCLYLTGGLIQNRRGPVGLDERQRLRQAIQLRSLRDRESAAVLPDHRPVPGQPLLRARSGARELERQPARSADLCTLDADRRT